MKLTKEEQGRLTAEILNDLPENYAFFSPYTSLWLINIVICCLFSGVLVTVIVELFSAPITFALGVGLFVCVLFCAYNVLLAQGYNIIGLRLARLFSLLSLVVTIAIFMIKGYGSSLLFMLIVSVSSVLITYSKYFLVFVQHRAKMMDWARERNKKNKAYKDKILEERKKCNSI